MNEHKKISGFKLFTVFCTESHFRFTAIYFGECAEQDFKFTNFPKKAHRSISFFPNHSLI